MMLRKLLILASASALVSALDTYNLEVIPDITIPNQCTLVSSPLSGCFAQKCKTEITLSPSYIMNETAAISLPLKSSFSMLSSPTCLVTTDLVTYDEQGEQVFIQTRTILLDKTPEYYVLAQPDMTSLQVFSGDGATLEETISINGAKLTYGSVDALCTYDTGKNNICRLMGV